MKTISGAKINKYNFLNAKLTENNNKKSTKNLIRQLNSHHSLEVINHKTKESIKSRLATKVKTEIPLKKLFLS